MNSRDAIETMTQADCWTMLDRHKVGRLAVDVGGEPDIFPINFLVDEGTIVFKTGAGTKLASAVLSRHVAFEIDGQGDANRTVWSVIVKGIAHEVDNMYERFEVEDLPLYPWVAGQKPRYVRIEPTLVTGRRFHVVDDAEVEPNTRLNEYQPQAAKMRQS